MRYEVNTTTGGNGRIISTVDEIDDQNVRLTIFRHVLETQDSQIKQALEKLGWTPPQAPSLMKCIVSGCTNHAHEGRFMGDLCSPCYTMLTSGTISGGTTFIHAMRNRITKIKSAIDSF